MPTLLLCELPDENEDGMFGTPQTEEEHTEKLGVFPWCRQCL